MPNEFDCAPQTHSLAYFCVIVPLFILGVVTVQNFIEINISCNEKINQTTVVVYDCMSIITDAVAQLTVLLLHMQLPQLTA